MMDKNKVWTYIKNLWTFKTIIVGIMFLTFSLFVYSCWDTYAFSNDVKDTAKKEIELQEQNKVTKDKNDLSIDSTQTVTNIENNSYNKNQQYGNTSSLLDILSKANKLLDARELAFVFTFIVALLSIFFGYKTIEVDKKIKEIEKNANEYKDKAIILENKASIFEKNANEYKDKAKKYVKKVESIYIFNYFLPQVQSIYNLSIIIRNMSMSLTQGNTPKNKIISTEIGSLCSRLSPICSQIENWLNDKKQKMKYITEDEKSMLDTYLDDAIGELERSKSTATRFNYSHLENIINNIKQKVIDIKEALNGVEILGN